ncbi:hypothetical protein K4K61_007761 [Colletotrichum sp. SAR11_59]|nr:hypothetical protein K4K61_007761 [Colletotrichum sp. SAR11_59]
MVEASPASVSKKRLTTRRSENDRLVHPLKTSDDGFRDRHACDEEASRFALSNSPYTKYFYSYCNFATQVVVTSPLSNNNLTIVGPRLLAGFGFTSVNSVHSGLVAYFEPQIGVNGSLAIGLQNSSEMGHAIEPIYEDNDEEGYSIMGVSGLLKFNSSATLTVHTLGGIRTIRDFSEGPGLLEHVMRDAVNFNELEYGVASIDRSGLNNVTGTTLTFTPADEDGVVAVKHRTLHSEAETYIFNASFNYPQLTQLPLEDTLAEECPWSDDRNGILLLVEYLIKNEVGRTRAEGLMSKEATVNPNNEGLTWQEPAQRKVKRIMNETAAFAAIEGQKKNRSSTSMRRASLGSGVTGPTTSGGSRIFYDVKAIVPVGLRAVAALAEAGFFPGHLDCAKKAADAAQTCRDEIWRFFEVFVWEEEAWELVDKYVGDSGFPTTSHSDNITEDVAFYDLAWQGNIDHHHVRVLNR